MTFGVFRGLPYIIDALPPRSDRATAGANEIQPFISGLIGETVMLHNMLHKKYVAGWVAALFVIFALGSGSTYAGVYDELQVATPGIEFVPFGACFSSGVWVIVVPPPQRDQSSATVDFTKTDVRDWKLLPYGASSVDGCRKQIGNLLQYFREADRKGTLPIDRPATIQVLLQLNVANCIQSDGSARFCREVEE